MIRFPSQRLGCRLLFVFGSVVPTILVVLWICWMYRPGYQRSMARCYSSRLGAHLRFDQVYWPKPHLTQISQPRIFDPESGRQLASAGQLTIHDRPDAVHMTFKRAKVQSDALRRLWEVYDDAVLKGKQGSIRVLHVESSGLQLMDPIANLELSDVAASVEQTASGPVTSLRFRLPNAPNSPEVEVELARWRNFNPPVTWFKVDTSRGPLSCFCLPSSWGLADWLGGDAAFDGLFMGNQAENGWNAHVVGTLSNVDLQRVSDKFHQFMSGKADIKNLKLSVKDGRVQSAMGEVNSTDGSISASLLNSLREHIARQPVLADSAEMVDKDKDVAFDWLSFRFVLEESGRLTLHATRTETEALMANRRQLLLRATPDSAITDVDLIRALVPVDHGDSETVPISKEVLPLITSLPLPGFKAR